MTFKDKHALETLPKTIAALQDEIRETAGQARRSEILRARPRRFEKVTAALGELQRNIAAAEEQWLELEILREEFAGG